MPLKLFDIPIGTGKQTGIVEPVGLISARWEAFRAGTGGTRADKTQRIAGIAEWLIVLQHIKGIESSVRAKSVADSVCMIEEGH